MSVFILQLPSLIKLNPTQIDIARVPFKIVSQKEDDLFEQLLSKYTKLDRGAELWAKFSDFNFYKFQVSEDSILVVLVKLSGFND